MDSTAATASPAAPASVESEVSLARLYVLRALYLLLVIGGGIQFLPQLIGHEPTARGVIPSMLGAMWVLACFGLRYPLQTGSLTVGTTRGVSNEFLASNASVSLERGVLLAVLPDPRKDV